MQKNITQLIQKYFFDYLICEDGFQKQNTIDQCIKKLPEQKNLIYRLKNIIDELHGNTAKSFVNNVFDVSNDIIRIDLIENIESQLSNKTTIISKVDIIKARLISFYNFEKEETFEECKITNDKVIINDFQERYIKKNEECDSYFYNYIVEMFLNENQNEMLLGITSNGNYVISNKIFPEVSNSTLVKEDSLCETKDIQYFIDRIIGENENKDKYLVRIFLDLITNQNYRILSNGFGIINSDLKENEYYVLNGVTLKKEVAIESFYRNYYEQIEDISNLVMDNYDVIIDLIDELINLKMINNQYLLNLKNNIIKVYKKGVLFKSLNSLEFGEEEKISEKRKNLNNDFEENMKKFKKSLGLTNPSLTKKGYASIFTLVLGIIIFGVAFALILIK